MKNRSAVIGMILLSSFMILPQCARGEDIPRSKYCVGLNYPGMSLRAFLGRRFALEIKSQYETDIVIAGLRSYYFFNPRSKLAIFAGIEESAIDFKGDDSEGTGLVSEAFVGGEYSFARNLSFQLDFGPAYVDIKDDDTSKSESEVEYVINLGLNLYFGVGGKQK
jgi:hypothetical protein